MENLPVFSDLLPLRCLKSLKEECVRTMKSVLLENLSVLPWKVFSFAGEDY